jgi:hypothetical protein
VSQVSAATYSPSKKKTGIVRKPTAYVSNSNRENRSQLFKKKMGVVSKPPKFFLYGVCFLKTLMVLFIISSYFVIDYYTLQTHLNIKGKYLNLVQLIDNWDSNFITDI